MRTPSVWMFHEADIMNHSFLLLISYAALGLLARLEPGMENGESYPEKMDADRATTQPLPKGKGRIIRDESGEVIGIDLAEDTRSDVEERQEGTEVIPKTSIVRGGWSRCPLMRRVLTN